MNLEDNPNIRPIGHKKVKEERYEKKDMEAYYDISEKLDKFIEVQWLGTTVRRW